MAVTIDTTATVFNGNTVTSFTNASHTVGATNGSALVLFLALTNTGSSVPVPIWDNTGVQQTMTLIGKKTGSTAVGLLFGLLAPHTGNKTLSVSWTAASNYAGMTVSFSGCDQASLATTFKNEVKDTSTPGAIGNYPVAGLTVTTNPGDMAIMTAGTGSGTFAAGGGLGTQVALNNTNCQLDCRYLSSVGASAVLAANANTASQNYLCEGCAIKASTIKSTTLRRYLRR